MEKISAVYKIVNNVTGDFYVGSSRNMKQRWAFHKCPSSWELFPNSKLYQDMQKYGVDKFRFQILAPVMPEYLKQVEQEFIELLQPTYNSYSANGRDVEKRRASNNRYLHSEKGRESQRKRSRKYQQSEKGKAYLEAYKHSEKCKAVKKAYRNQLCYYNGETLTLNTLSARFLRASIPHPVLEAKKYLVQTELD